jgi:hypothetical protein
LKPDFSSLDDEQNIDPEEDIESIETNSKDNEDTFSGSTNAVHDTSDAVHGTGDAVHATSEALHNGEDEIELLSSDRKGIVQLGRRRAWKRKAEDSMEQGKLNGSFILYQCTFLANFVYKQFKSRNVTNSNNIVATILNI